ncbi:tyrosine protein phosphatase yvh1, partial [Elasticomyces elasticus]
MPLMDRVPGPDDIYIGGSVDRLVRFSWRPLFALRRNRADLQSTNVTHVLSVLTLPLDRALFDGFEHHVVGVDDVDDEDLLSRFPETNRFIQDGLEKGGAVLVHCAMGKSRSATCVIAFLVHKYQVSPEEALAQIRQSRPLCEPNEGFMKQLELYHTMQAPNAVADKPAYQRWLYQREVEL